MLGLANISLGHKWSFIWIGTKFSAMLSNRKWTYIEVVPILRSVNRNLCTICFETWYRDHALITLSAIRKGMRWRGMRENMQTTFEFNLIKLLLKSFIHFYGVKLNTMDPMMLIKFIIQNLTQDQPENSHQIISHFNIHKRV